MSLDRRQFLITTVAADGASVFQKIHGPMLDRGFAQVTRIADGVYGGWATGSMRTALAFGPCGCPSPLRSLQRVGSSLYLGSRTPSVSS